MQLLSRIDFSVVILLYEQIYKITLYKKSIRILCYFAIKRLCFSFYPISTFYLL
jgi:hypothetical protein